MKDYKLFINLFGFRVALLLSPLILTWAVDLEL